MRVPVYRVSCDAFMLLDCGEGSWGQLVRLLGRNEAEAVAAHLTAIYVSHHHADHHMGLITLLQARAHALRSKGLAVRNAMHTKRLSVSNALHTKGLSVSNALHTKGLSVSNALHTKRRSVSNALTY